MKAITHLFEESVDKYSNNVFLWEKKGNKYEPSTYKQIKEQVYKFAAGLIALGIKKGDRIALLAEGRNEWVISELGILYAGGVNVPLSIKLNADVELRFRLEHSEARMIIISSQQARKVARLKFELPTLEKVILLDSPCEHTGKDILFSEIIQLGTIYLKDNYSEFEQRWKSVTGSDMANICYTSGTETYPKGTILTHRNYTANTEQSLTLMNIPENFISLLILPWDHAFAHTAGIYVFMSSGASIASVQYGKSPMESLKNIPVNIKEIKPHLLFSVPSLAKSFKKQIEKGIREKGFITTILFLWGLSIAYAYNGIGMDKGKGLRVFLKLPLMLFDKILFSKVRQVLGGNLQFFIGGGAMLDIELQRFYYAIGIPMFQGYGLTEASPVISSNVVLKHKLGTSGYLVKPLGFRICDESGKALQHDEKGEIVVSGENVMSGYWKNPEATIQSIKDGWLHTGDLGSIDKEGFLYVYGRYKSLLIADDGEKYSPEGMEETFVAQSPYIEQCFLYNNQNQYTVALIVPSKDGLNYWMQKHSHHHQGIEHRHCAAIELIEEALNEYRTGKKFSHMFPQRWLPSAIGILPEAFTEDNQLMNSTLKIVRHKITDRYKDLIKFLYTPEAKNICNYRNLKNFEMFMS